MTNVKTRKWLSLAVAALMVLGMLSFLPSLPVAQAASYSSSWFTDKSAINVASVHEGITLRPTEKTPKEYGYDSENGVYRTYDQNVVNLEHRDEGVEITRATSYATYSNLLYLGEKFSIEFEVLKKNFKTLEISFLSDDDTKVDSLGENNANIRVHDIENKVVIPADKLTAGSTYTLVCTTAYNQSTGRYTLSFSGIEGIEVEDLETIPLNQAQVKFGFTGVGEVFAKDSSNEDEEDNTEYDYASICLTKMGEGEHLQSFVTRNADSTIIDDTQKPVIRIDSAKMNSEDGVDDIIVRNAEYSLGYTALDVIKSSSSTKMTVKFTSELPDDYAEKSAEDQAAFWNGEDIEVFKENITTTKFTPNKIGYYAITSLTASDGTNTSDTLVKNDNTTVTTLVFRVVERLDNVYDTTNSSKNAAIGYNFDNYKAKYAQFPKTLEGGSNATVTFITPTLWAPENYTVADLTPAEGETESKVEKDFKAQTDADVYSIIGVEGEGDSAKLIFETNVNAVTYSLKYRLSTSTSYTTLTGLKFTPSAKGPYDFSLSMTDRVGNKTEYNVKQNFLEGIGFYDTESPVITVTGFSETAYLNQSTTIVSGSISDNFDTSATKTVKVILVAKYKTNANGELVDKDGKKIDTSGDYEDYKDQLVVDTEAVTWKQKQGLFKVNDDNKPVDAEGNVLKTENNKLVNESDVDKLVRDDIEGVKVKDPDGNYVMVDDYEQDYEKDAAGKAVLDEDGNKQYLYEMNEDGTYKVDSEGRRIPLYTQKNRQELVISTSTTFTPTDYGVYRVVYEGKDSSGNLAGYQVNDLYVVPAPPAPSTGISLSTTSIVFLCVAGACLIGIIVLLLIPTKEVPQKASSKPAKKDEKKDDKKA